MKSYCDGYQSEEGYGFREGGKFAQIGGDVKNVSQEETDYKDEEDDPEYEIVVEIRES
jgi:hypothetical protein